MLVQGKWDPNYNSHETSSSAPWSRDNRIEKYVAGGIPLGDQGLHRKLLVCER